MEKRGKLRLKTPGGKGLKPSAKKEKRKHKKSKQKERKETQVDDTPTDGKDQAEEEDEFAGLTPAQRRHAEHQKKKEEEEIEKAASKTYRERVEEMNQYLSNLTEHHDVPRVSAAGNG